MSCSDFIKEAQNRGLVYQCTSFDNLKDALNNGMCSAYLGIDATAKSLHVGHLLPIMLMRLFQKCGHKPIILLGGGTTKIGDPSFKNIARPILSDDEILKNIIGIKACLSRFLNFDDSISNNAAILVNNADWLDKLEYIPFLRKVGQHFSINRMITLESVKSRLSENNTLSFLEFNYMIMQSYDFLKLYEKYGCVAQFGGQDQWGNIICGVDLVRRIMKKEVFGMTCPLLTTSNGVKMGKTAAGAVWLDSNLFSEFDFWQYFRNVDDSDVDNLLMLFTDLTKDELERLKSLSGEDKNEAKIILADSITSLVHGKSCIETIHKTVDGIFGNAGIDNIDENQYINVKVKDLVYCTIVDVLVNYGLSDSRGEAKRLIRNGGVYVDSIAVTEKYNFLEIEIGDVLKIAIGKKKFIIIKVK